MCVSPKSESAQVLVFNLTTQSLVQAKLKLKQS